MSRTPLICAFAFALGLMLSDFINGDPRPVCLLVKVVVGLAGGLLLFGRPVVGKATPRPKAERDASICSPDGKTPVLPHRVSPEGRRFRSVS